MSICMDDRTDRWMDDGQMDEMMLHILTSFTICKNPVPNAHVCVQLPKWHPPSLYHGTRLLNPVCVALPRKVHIVVWNLIMIIQWLAPLCLWLLHFRQLFACVHIH
jgi:hypothetical protein